MSNATLTLRLVLTAAATLFVLAACVDPYNGDVFPPEDETTANLNTELPDEQEPEFNPWVQTSEDNLATFSVDVDTASYTQARRDINAGRLPPPEKVRVEEFVNFFRYEYEAPTFEDPEPFAINVEAAPSQFGENLQVLRVGIQAKQIPDNMREPANLVFLIDVSGSMQSADKIGLVKYSLKTALNYLAPSDTISIVTYAGRDAVVLNPTPASNRGAILEAIDNLQAGGGTNGEAGILTAYNLAQSVFVEGGTNRVILATDGDFNVGITGEELIQEVETWRSRNIRLTVLGYGEDAAGDGNFQDGFLEDLTNRGDGNFAFIDTHNEARRVLGERITSTLQVVAKDVKIQVEFNSDVISRYRLIGYENRVLDDNDFDNDAIDAGEIGAGHFVTAYLEFEMNEGVEPGPVKIPPSDILYEEAAAVAATPFIEVFVRYKEPEKAVSELVSQSFRVEEIYPSFEQASGDFRFGAAVTEFAEILRYSPFVASADFDAVAAIAEGAITDATTEDRTEFVQLVRAAKPLYSTTP